MGISILVIPDHIYFTLCKSNIFANPDLNFALTFKQTKNNFAFFVWFKMFMWEDSLQNILLCQRTVILHPPTNLKNYFFCQSPSFSDTFHPYNQLASPHLDLFHKQCPPPPCPIFVGGISFVFNLPVKKRHKYKTF